jgi:hypothetical protein
LIVTQALPQVLQALRLPELYRLICRQAGLPLAGDASRSSDRFILRCGQERPDLFAKLLEEAFLEDEAEVPIWPTDAAPDYRGLPPGSIAVRPGFDAPCPDTAALLQAASEGGPALVFAIERRDEAGRLLAVTWAAIPEEEPPPEADFRAAVLNLLPAADEPLMDEE